MLKIPVNIPLAVNLDRIYLIATRLKASTTVLA